MTTPLKISYPWFRPVRTPPTVLWVCTGCGEAFWAVDVDTTKIRYLCCNNCPKAQDPEGIRRATAEEIEASKMYLTIGDVFK